MAPPNGTRTRLLIGTRGFKTPSPDTQPPGRFGSGLSCPHVVDDTTKVFRGTIVSAIFKCGTGAAGGTMSAAAGATTSTTRASAAATAATPRAMARSCLVEPDMSTTAACGGPDRGVVSGAA